MVNGEKITKARLVVRGFEETHNVQNDSPTAGRETLLRVFLALSASQSWPCQTIDIQAAFDLQGNDLTGDVFIKPPSEVVSEGVLWKLTKCVYGLSDAYRTWYFSVLKELCGLNCRQSVIDPALFLLART